MKIAVVGPSPIPFTIGGNENLLWGLTNAINQLTPHQAELIKVPGREDNFWNLIDSYYRFYQLDLTHFDGIITTKYPSWMTRHPNSIIYMVHTLRGLYDTYHYFNMPQQAPRGNRYIDAVKDYMAQNPAPASLDAFFALLFGLKEHLSEIPAEYFAFPGPFAHEVVHYMDNAAMAAPGVKHFYAISNTVRDRAYYPLGAQVETVYPPCALSNCQCGAYDYVFMISRLDAPKRIDMLIEAMKYVQSDIRLLIAGTGPEKERLHELAKDDARITFLGFVTDAQVEEYYANCLCVPYFPQQEDLGLITLETMMHKKPVITTVDAGGPMEFVTNGETGFVEQFDAQAIARRIDYLAQNPEKARRMGENAYQRVKNITWQSVVDGLLNEWTGLGDRRPLITVTSTFGIYPPQGGGQARIFNLYREVAKKYNVQVQALCAQESDAVVAPGLREICTKKTKRQIQQEEKISQEAGIPAEDIAAITLWRETPLYTQRLGSAISRSKVVIISHPYLYQAAKPHLGDTPFIYEAHNVESAMKDQMLPASPIKQPLVDLVFETERACCEESALIITCSDEDRTALHSRYNVSFEKMVVVPNGVSCTDTSYTSPKMRAANKLRMGLMHEKIGLFMGSWHGPNLEACMQVLQIARLCPSVKFLLMGSQCAYLQNERIPLPRNVGLLGLVNEEEKQRVFSAVDFALNPMLSGSGTNLKMFDYMAAGIPVITTAFGTRGIERKDLFTIAEPVEDMAAAIRAFAPEKAQQMAQMAYEYVKNTFDWPVIAQTLLDKIHALGLQ